MIDLIITGTGRSGTGYMSKVLTAAGMPCGHERVFTYDGPRHVPELDADSSWMALPWLTDESFADVNKVLIYRHPQQVIASLMGIGFFDQRPHPAHQPYLNVIRGFAPHVFGPVDPFERACEWYVEANAWAMRYCQVVEPVEDIRWHRIAPGWALDFDRATKLVPRNYNTRGTKPIVPPLPQIVWDVYEELNERAGRPRDGRS